MKRAEQEKGDPQVAAIRRAVDLRLKARMRDEAIGSAADTHPDEDVINAFVEGCLEESKTDSLTSHLVSCAACLHLTAQLIRYDPEMDEAAGPTADVNQGSLRRFVDRLTSEVVPSIGGDSVFAYQINSESTDKTEKSEPDSDSSEPDK